MRPPCDNYPRLLPDEPLPAYAFVPGRFPHPESDPAGHSHGKPRPVSNIDPARWPSCRVYLRGIDLFNCGFPWESHVEFESLWIACGRKGLYANFFKALIHLAAANVKHLEGVHAGVRSHAARAAELWRGIAGQMPSGESTLLGFSLPWLIAVADEIRHHGWPEASVVLVPELSR